MPGEAWAHNRTMTIERRSLGRTGLQVSALGFGCGAVGGLMVRGQPADQERAVARAVEAGITFFDTAPMYGDGASEENLGRVLARLRPEVVLATKFMVPPVRRPIVPAAIVASFEASLTRLGRDDVDLLQLHNPIGRDAGPNGLDPAIVLDEVVATLEQLRSAGRIRSFGITAVGTPDAVARVLDSGAFDTAQVPFNLLNPDGGGVLPHAAERGMGTIGIRALAGGALSGSTWRHPTGMSEVAPMGTGETYEADVAAAQRFRGLVDGGLAGSLVEAALRFAVGSPHASTVLVGVSTLEQLEDAIAAAERGRLPSDALAEIDRVRIAGGQGGTGHS